MSSIPPKNDAPWRFKKGHKTWNAGSGGCKKGHDPSLYVSMPSGVYLCLGCKRENGAKYRAKNQGTINLRGRVSRYGISVDDLQGMMDAQGGRCAICQAELEKVVYRIDHNHETGEVRGLLCASCNTGLGLMKDSIDILENAKKYLRKNGR